MEWSDFSDNYVVDSILRMFKEKSRGTIAFPDKAFQLTSKEVA